MKFLSKAQFNFFQSVAQGTRKANLTPKQAAKDLKGKSAKGLKDRVPKKVPQKKK